MQFIQKKGIFFGLLILSAPGSWGAEFKVKCLADNGQIVGGDATNTCKNTLPKCSEVKADLLKTVKTQLSTKIYGYMKGWDLDLNKTTPEAPSGTRMPIQMCSVVGHQIQYQGARDLEFNIRRNMSNKPWRGNTQALTGASCGEAPLLHIEKGPPKKLYPIFRGGSGTLWSSWMLGSMPYLVRANSYRFFQGLTDMSKVDSLLNSTASVDLKAEYERVNAEVEAYFRALPAESKAACEAPAWRGLVDSCLGRPGAEVIPVTHPAVRNCEIVKAQFAMTTGALSNLVINEILVDARAEYDQKVAGLLNTSGAGWTALVDAAVENTENWTSGSFRTRGAKAASGVMGDGCMKTYESYDIHPSTDCPKNRTGSRYVAFRLDRDQPEAGSISPITVNFSSGVPSIHLNSGFMTPVANRTIAKGFPGLVEYVVRRQICGQSSPSSPSPQCDEREIPDKPAGIQW